MPAFDTASTRFYITLNESVQRDRNYCVFGKIKSSKYTILKDDQVVAGGFSAPSLSSQFINDMLNLDTESKETKDTVSTEETQSKSTQHKSGDNRSDTYDDFQVEQNNEQNNQSHKH